ncbi:MAG TPA: HPF/RaiA family ribosome-associated protein [Candidatus Acidoferrales bacterium]|nr:HPF/RaiA family ribosome-associated protein [Candidatus Acidoferrales bacterium]
MKTHIRYRGIGDREGVQRELRRQTAKLQRHLKKFEPDLVDLHVSLDRESRPIRPFVASVTLDLPPRQLYASESGPEAVPALKYAFAELWREVKKLKAKLQRKKQLHRSSPRRPTVPV